MATQPPKPLQAVIGAPQLRQINNNLDGPQSLPRNPGTIIGKIPRAAIGDAKALTPMEERLLAQTTWAPGDPVPDLSQTSAGRRLTMEAEQIRRGALTEIDGMTPVPPNTPPLQIPDPIPIEQLSSAEQAKVYQSLQEMSELQQSLNAAKLEQMATTASQAKATLPPQIAGIPGMQEAWMVARTAQGSNPKVEDDIGMFDIERSKPEDIQKAPEPVIESVPEPEPDVPAEDHTEPNESPVRGDCPHCGCDLDETAATVTAEDKSAYVQTVLAGQRFVKMYKLYGNRLGVTFHSLLASEVAMIITQLDADIMAGKIMTPLQYNRRELEYRIAASIDRFQRVGKQVVEPQPIGQLDFNEDENVTALPEMVTAVNNRLCVTDEVRRTVGNMWVQFDKLCKHLEVRAEDPDFYGAIENLP